MKILFLGVMTAFLCTGPAAVASDKPRYLDLARSGWSYQLRTTMVGRDLSIPIHINGKDMSGAALCVIGEKPSEQTMTIITAFRELSALAFGKPLPMRYAGLEAKKL